jgi:hypothetical protein
LFGVLQAECGYTPAEIRAMTLHDVKRLNAHWRKHPPLRVLVSLVAASLGVKLPEISETSTASHLTGDEAMRLFRATGGRIDGIGGA